MIYINLRDYQIKLVQDIRQAAKEYHSIVAILGCGGGKSIIQAEIARNATDKGHRVLFIVHRKELCRQIEQTFTMWGVNMELCTVGMVQTVSRRLEDTPPPALIITDEAHHSTAATYRRIYDHFHEAWRLGFTATPIRLNRGGLGEVYEHMIESVSTKWLIDNAYLAPYKYYSAPLADTSKLHTHAGEFKNDEVQALMDSKTIYGETVKQWERLARGKKTICYCAGVKAARKTADEFRAAGYTSYSLDGKTPQNERDSVMKRFRSGEIAVLCNADLFGEGLDVPDCECVCLLRPTQSLTLHIQQSMRSMRYMDGKTAIILDFVQNCRRHGLPDDPREWSLEPKKKQENIVKIRECKECFAVYPPTADRCPVCGAEATHETRTINRKTVDVDLEEVRRTEEIKNTRYDDLTAETWEEVREIQKAKNFKFQWALHYCIKHGIPYPPKYEYMVRRYLR